MPQTGQNGQSVAGGVADRLDRDLAARAIRKLTAGEQLSAPEKAALRRYEKEREEKLRWQYHASIPQKHWREMSGRQAKVINEQAARYAIPFGGATISLPAVVRALHDFLAANAQKLAQDDDGLMAAGVPSPALERYREERAAIARLDRLERERQLVSRHDTLFALARIALIVRKVGEALERQFGPAAADLLCEALDEAERETARAFGDADDDHPTDGQALAS